MSGAVHLWCTASLVHYIFGGMHLLYGESLVWWILGMLHLWRDASLMSCIYDVMHLWCAESLVRCIFVVLHLCRAASLVNYIFITIFLWCTAYSVRCIFGVIGMHFWFALHRHLWWCLVGAITIVQYIFGVASLLLCIVSYIAQACYRSGASTIL